MKRLSLLIFVLASAFSLNGCIFFGGNQLKAMGTLTHQNEFEHAKERPPQWVETGQYNGEMLYGIGSAYNLTRFNAIEDARTSAIGNLAEKIRAQVEVQVTQSRTTEGVLGANSFNTKRIIEERVSEMLRNVNVKEVFVFKEEVWGPGQKKIWRTKAYALVTTDLDLYSALAPTAE